ncbi:MAG: right-handed parallel beta-helix repeat-containing protein [Rudaea sp.]|nr:right-handed parallel beta-helix repeat-containing protein [Rudaea sp.]
MKLPMILPMLALAMAPLAASAVPGALEINKDCIAVGCFAGDAPGYPVTITQPGSYILTSDLAPPGDSNTNAIEVSASPVDVDLNGHTVDGGGTCTGTPVTSCAGFAGNRGLNFSNNGNPGVFHLHDGTVRGFGSGGIVVFDSGDGTVLDHLTVTQNNYGALIVASTTLTTTRVRDSQFVRNNQSGMTVANGTNRLLIENSTAVGNATTGFVMGLGSVAVGNRISSNGNTGLYCGDIGAACGLGQNVFSLNNGGGAAPQFQVTTLRDMGGNVCLEKAACP